MGLREYPYRPRVDLPHSWPEIDRTFAEHGEGAGLYVQDSRTFGPDCLIVHLAQFRWWLGSVEGGGILLGRHVESPSKTEEDNDPERHMCCRRCNDMRGSPLSWTAPTTRWSCAPKYNGCRRVQFVVSRRLRLREGLLVVATPGTLAEYLPGLAGCRARASWLLVVRSAVLCVY